MSEKNNKRYYLGYFLEALPENSKFIDWPLHITLVPWFKINTSVELCVDALRQYTALLKIFEVKVGRKKRWGSFRVNTIEPNSELQLLNQNLVSVVKEQGAITAPLRFVGKYYRPHITQKPWDAAEQGQQLTLDQISLLEANQDIKSSVRPKKILANIRLVL